MSDESETFSASVFVVEVANELASWRKKDYTYWTKIVGIIHKYEGNIEDFDCYDLHSKTFKLNSYVNSDSYKNTTITSLFEWIKEDNKELYNEVKVHRQELLELLYRNFNEAEASLIFYNVKPNNYIYVEEYGWYSVNENNIWIQSSKLPCGMADDIYKTFKNLVKEHLDNLDIEEKELRDNYTPNDDYRKKMDTINDKKKKIMSILNKFKTSFIKSMSSFLEKYYNDNNAKNLMNSNTNLFSCNNKVFDCLTGEWRDIRQTDYISITTGYNYYEKRDKVIEEKIYNFFKSCFETEDVANYFLTTIARCLYGHRDCEMAQKFYIFLGNGRNGKGLSFKLITRVFGGEDGYFKSIDNKELTKQQTKANEPLPGLANSKGKRCVLTTEPEDNEQIQVAIVKKITGGDTLQFRDLFQRGKGCEYQAQFGLFFQTNHKPIFKLDSAFLNRLIVINYPYKFKASGDIDVNNPNEKIADNNLGMLFSRDDYRLEFLHILVDIFKKYNLKDEGMAMPQKVKDYIKEVVDENNVVGVWLEKNYKPKEEVVNPLDNATWIKSTELMATFRADTHSMMSDKEFISQMEHNKYTTSKATKDLGDIKKNNSIFKGLVRTTPKPMNTMINI